MPAVRMSDLLGVVQQLWDVPGASTDDRAKAVLAEVLVREAWERGNRQGLELSSAGSAIKSALGSSWLSAHERLAAGLPKLIDLLRDDPYFALAAPAAQPGAKQAVVKLRISRLSKLIGRPELIAEYRAPAEREDAGYDGAGSSSSQRSGSQGQAVGLTDDGLPIRPGQRACPHYVKFGWCLFKQECWYSHPNDSKPRSGSADPPVFESDSEPGLMLINGINPIRPGAKPCAFWLKNGWCQFKAKCRLHHPLPSELGAAGSSSSSRGAAGPLSPTGTSESDSSLAAAASQQQQQQGEAPTVRQPPLQVLLCVIIDAVWPPSSSPAACAKGGLAKFIVQYKADEVAARLFDKDAAITVPGALAGQALMAFWRGQSLYDSGTKPYSGRLADMLEQDPLFRAGRPQFTVQEPPTFTLLLGQLITTGAGEASRFLSTMADVVWPPNSGKDAWLRGSLAKWLLRAGFEGNNGEVLRSVLAVGPELPTVFRIDVAQAGEYLRRCWATMEHPYNSSAQPWPQSGFKRLIADDRFFCIEPAPGSPNSQHVTLDLMDIIKQLPRLHRRRAAQQSSGGGGDGGSIAQQQGGNGASSSSSAAGASNSRGVSASGGAAGVMEVDDDTEDTSAAGSGFAAMLQATAAAAAAAENSFSAPGPSSSSSSGGGGGHRGGASSSTAGVYTALDADMAAVEALRYIPPPEGVGPRKLQRWWPHNKGGQQGWVWIEVAISLLSPDGEDAPTRIAEMIQHLELSRILGVACATYAQRPHLLQFFAPYASIGGLEMPAAVYLLDLAKPRGDVRNTLSLVAPVLSSRDNIKVCHSSKQWSGMLAQKFGLRLEHYIDCQQTNHTWKALMREIGHKTYSDAELARTSEVSLTALLSTLGFYHPVDSAKLKWQERPLSEELITAAAADVTYLIPVMEMMARLVSQAAAAVVQQQSKARGRAAQMHSLPPELADSSVLATIAAGVDGPQRGSISLNKLADWASLNAFHQVPWHDADA